MARTSVSRRLVYIKKTRNPVAPLPRKQDPARGAASVTATRSRAAAMVRRPAAPASGAKLVRSAAVFIGLICAGAAIAVMGQARPRPASHADQDIAPAAPPPAVRALPSASDDYRSVGLPAVLSQRAAPTDESFRAAGYARRK